MRNNALSLATRADTPLERGFLKPWIDRLHQHDVVVLNTGTSATGAPAEIADVISRAVDHALANTPLTTTIVYRDTPFGHASCAAHKGGEPLESNAAAEEWLERHPGPARYNWSNIPRVNAAARLALEDRLQHPSRLLWLPAASISATRIDAHPANAHPATDCLHYCMPGKPRHSPATSRRPARPRLSVCNWRGHARSGRRVDPRALPPACHQAS